MPIIALDRDGVINVDSADYIKSAEEWNPLPGSIEAIALLCAKGYQVFVATNQAGLARGLFTEGDLMAMHEKLQDLVSKAGGNIDGIFYCPHHPEDDCECRKPQPGLLRQIESAASESLKGQPFVGDSRKDIEAALALGAKPVLVRTGNGSSTEIGLSLDSVSVETYDNLLEFAKQIPEIKT